MNDPAAGWSRLHHGLDPHSSGLLWRWLTAMWWLARPLARLRVSPGAITVAGAALACAAVFVVRREPLLAVTFVLGSVVADGLDGAVAVLQGAASRFGALADKIADRTSDIAFAAVLWRCGVPASLAILAGLGMLAVEVLREVRSRPVVITVAERPTRTICTVLACGSVAISSAHWPVLVCAWVLVGLSALALVQLSRSAALAS